jgi:hypothetical protein
MQLERKPVFNLLHVSVLATCLAMTACGGGDSSTEQATQEGANAEGVRTAQSGDMTYYGPRKGTQGAGVDEDASTESIQEPAPPGPDGVCKDFYPADAQLIAGQVTKPWATTAKPVRGVAVKEANWGTCQVRVTDYAADGLQGFARNDYSRRQAFNADSTYQLVSANSGHWYLYNTLTNQKVNVPNSTNNGALPGVAGDAEPQWHPSNPNVLFYLPTNGVGMKLYRLNVATGVSSLKADFSTRLKARWPDAMAAWTKSEGSPSADGRYWCFMVDGEGWQGRGIFTWDRNTDQILGMADLKDRPDHVSMSPSGNHCVVSNYGGPGVLAYSRDLSSSKKIANIGEHSDIGLDANGDDAYISVDYQDNGGSVYTVNVRTGVRTNLFPTYLEGTATALHFSGKSFNKPGWFLMSSYAEGGGTQKWLHRKIVAVQMAASPLIYNLADTRTTSKKQEGYFSEPHASVNREFSRIVWNSNWNSSDADALKVDAYTVQIKPTMLAPFSSSNKVSGKGAALPYVAMN